MIENPLFTLPCTLSLDTLNIYKIQIRFLSIFKGHDISGADEAVPHACVSRVQPRVSAAAGELRLQGGQHSSTRGHLKVPAR